MRDRRQNQLRIRAGDPLRYALQATQSRFATGRINAIADRFLAIVEEQRPDLTDNEWLAICDANNGYGLIEEMQAGDGTGGSIEWTGLWMNLADSPELAEKWNIDLDALVRKLRGFSTAQTIAMAETVQRFWAYTRMPTNEVLAMIKTHPVTWSDKDNGFDVIDETDD